MCLFVASNHSTSTIHFQSKDETSDAKLFIWKIASGNSKVTMTLRITQQQKMSNLLARPKSKQWFCCQ
jgi:hypothetical protein